MEGFIITINGKQVCTVGIQDEGLVSVDVGLQKLPEPDGKVIPNLHITVHGLLDVPQDSSEEFDASDSVVWLNQPLSLGDEIRITVVDTPQSDPPQHQERRFRYEGCAFCGTPRRDLSDAVLIAGAEATICHQCVADYLTILSREAEEQFPRETDDQAGHACAFCGKAVRDVARMFEGHINTIAICDACIRLCGEVLEETHTPQHDETSEDDTHREE